MPLVEVRDRDERIADDIEAKSSEEHIVRQKANALEYDGAGSLEEIHIAEIFKGR